MKCEKCGAELLHESLHVGGRGYVSFVYCPESAEPDDGHTFREATQEELMDTCAA